MLVVALTLCLVNIVAFGWWLVKSGAKKHFESVVSKTFDSTEMHTNSSQQITNFTSDTNMVTAVGTEHAFAVPAFIKVLWGIDFVVGEQINRGGQGSICKAEVVGALLSRRSHNVAVVVKVADSAV